MKKKSIVVLCLFLIVSSLIYATVTESEITEAIRTEAITTEVATTELTTTEAAITKSAIIEPSINEVVKIEAAFNKITTTQSIIKEKYMHAIWYNLYDGTIDIQYESAAKVQIENQLRKFKDMRINTVFLLVKLPDGKVYYPSKYAPQVNNWDSLAYVISKCHEYGMELHPYLNVMAETGYYLKEHPQYAEYTNNGLPLKWVSPAIPDVMERFRNIVRELVENYEIDGLQLDRIRYYTPQEMSEDPDFKNYPKGAISDTGYNPISLALYKEKYKKDAVSHDPDFIQYKCDLVTSYVKTAREIINAIKPSLKLSCSVYATPKLAMSKGCFQQWDKWFNEGLVDLIVTMAYHETLNRFNFYVSETINSLNFSNTKTKLVIGMGVYLLRPLPLETRKSIFEKKIELVLNTKEIAGICYFNGFSILKPEVSHIVEKESLKMDR